jgi:hypothetical protein
MDDQHIMKAKISAFKGAISVEIHGADEVNQIIGNCADGKTSTLQAMQAAIGGAKQVPSRPVTIGEEQAMVELETEDLELAIVIPANDNDPVKWVCRGKDGGRYNRGDLDQMVQKIWFDPTLWATKNKADKLDDLMKLAPPAWTERYLQLRSDLKQAEDERLVAGRELRALGELPSQPLEVKAVDVVELSEHLEAIRKHNDEQQGLIKLAQDHERKVTEVSDEIARLQTKLEQLLYQRETLQKPLPLHDPEPIRKQLANARETNAAASLWNGWVEKQEVHRNKSDCHRQAELSVDRCRKAQREHAGELQLPVKGLYIDPDGNIFYNDLPVPEGVNEGEMILISAELAMAQHQTLRVMFLQRGESLDDQTFKRLVALGKKYRVQTWLASGRMHGDGSEGLVIQLSRGLVSKVMTKKATYTAKKRK